MKIKKKKTDYDAKVTEIEKTFNDHNHDKYITTPGFHKLAADDFNARITQENLITKTEFDDKLLSLNNKITSNKTKHEKRSSSCPINPSDLQVCRKNPPDYHFNIFLIYNLHLHSRSYHFAYPMPAYLLQKVLNSAFW